jgi:hypothetical protein
MKEKIFDRAICYTGKTIKTMGHHISYQNGPETPYFHATFDDWSNVAAQVHWLTTTLAVNPVLT